MSATVGKIEELARHFRGEGRVTREFCQRSAPEWSEYRDDRQIHHLWHCWKCGCHFETEIDPIEDIKTRDDVFPSLLVA
jgi:hypothetical protein